MGQPFIIVMEGDPPSDGEAISGLVHGLFAGSGEVPEFIVCTHLPKPPRLTPPEWWMSTRRGYIFLDFSEPPGMYALARLLRLVQIQNAFVRHKPQEVASYIRHTGIHRIVLLMDGNHDLILYAAKLLRLIPEVPASLYVGSEPLGYLRFYRNPFSKRRISRSFEYLLRRCDPRYVGNELIRSLYEERFGITFGVHLPPVRDEYFREFSAKEPPQLKMDAGLRVFVSGSMHKYLNNSIQCLGRAFSRAAGELGQSPKLVFCGNWTSERLQEQGFAPEQLEGLGRLPSEWHVIEQASQAGCAFIGDMFDLPAGEVPTFLPSRMSDYLIAGSPIIALSFQNSALANYFKRLDLPLLCEGLNEQALAALLVRVARLTGDERKAMRQRYLSVLERFHLASRMRAELLGQHPNETVADGEAQLRMSLCEIGSKEEEEDAWMPPVSQFAKWQRLIPTLARMHIINPIRSSLKRIPLVHSAYKSLQSLMRTR